MRDLFLIGFLASIFLIGFRRPFMFMCAYVYVDVVSPQRLSYYLLSSIPISLIVFTACFIGWALNDDKRLSKPTPRQLLLTLLLALCAMTTMNADFPDSAADKWSWVWKALVFAIFMPATLYTRVRIEGILLFMLLSLSSIAITGGIKTLAGGGGYGTLSLMVSNNSGMYEGSTLSTFSIASIPLLLYMVKHSILVPPSIFSRLYLYGIVFACLLIPIGTQARTGLLCIAMLVILGLRATKRRMLYIALVAGLVATAIPFLPESYTERMSTIKEHKGEGSASTRLAVWKWTIDYVKENPFGGGFNCFLGNKLRVDMSYETADGSIVRVVGYDQSRAFHNSYFEMLGEQGYLGLALYLIIHLTGIIRMEVIRRTYAKHEGEHAWVAPLATALQHGHLIFMLGSSFVGIAFQPYIYFLIAVEIGFDRFVQTHVKKKAWNPFRRRKREIETHAEAEAAAAEAETKAAAEAEAARLEPAMKDRRRSQPRWGTLASK